MQRLMPGGAPAPSLRATRVAMACLLATSSFLAAQPSWAQTAAAPAASASAPQAAPLTLSQAYRAALAPGVGRGPRAADRRVLLERGAIGLRQRQPRGLGRGGARGRRGGCLGP